MATTRLIPIHIGKSRSVGTAISDIMNYVKNPAKTDDSKLITSYECDSYIADAEFLFSKRQYTALTGRDCYPDDIIAYHLWQSFVPGEVTPEKANRIGRELAKRFTQGRYAFIVCTHIDKRHNHNHIIWNSTSLDYTHKFRNLCSNINAVRQLNDTLCIENGLSIVENPQRHNKSYYKWLGDNVKPSHRELLRIAIDTALIQEPADFDTLISLLQKTGYDCKSGKVLALRGENQKQFIRLDTLGSDYSEGELRAVLSGEKLHNPCKNVTQSVSEKQFNLLVDIQAALRARKGVGYERWAKVFNLKQMAQTVNYLTEHNLLEYSALAEKAKVATTQYNQLSTQIKAIETRLTEIAILKTHIINYTKTCDIYAAYRKAGYPEKYLAEHESDILLYKAAKKAFSDLDFKKLPTVSSLQAEYEALLSEKKRVYAIYRKVRNDWKNLLTVKANIDCLFGTDNPETNKNKEHEQR